MISKKKKRALVICLRISMMIPLEKLSQQMDHHFLGSRPEQNYETAGTTSVRLSRNIINTFFVKIGREYQQP